MTRGVPGRRPLAARPAWRRRLAARPAWRRLAGPAILTALALLAIAGCAALGAAFGTASALQGAGYQNVSVNLVTGSGAPAGGLVRVSYSSGPTGDDQQDGEHAERIVWNTLRFRFGVLVIVKSTGGCAGPVCAGESAQVARVTYAGMAARFGPRPRGLDASSAAGPVRFPGWAVALAVGLSVAITVAAVVVVAMLIRSSRRATRVR